MTGIICLNKPQDITSFGVVAKIRGITRERKAGHTGTLDPLATGVLPIMLGGATKFLNYIEDSDKGYTATFVLGITTDTLDITGNVLSKSEVNVTKNQVENVLQKYLGTIQQVPPMYSAKSVDGVRLYDLARKGIEIERKSCTIEIKKLNLINSNENENEYTIDVMCSKGTYIRSLIDDIGKDLGCGATMTKLVRTQAMGFSLDDCVTLEQLQYLKDNELGFDDVIIDIEKILQVYDSVNISQPQTVRFCNGGALDLQRIKQQVQINKYYRVLNPDNEFLGLGISDGQELKVARLLVKRD